MVLNTRPTLVACALGTSLFGCGGGGSSSNPASTTPQSGQPVTTSIDRSYMGGVERGERNLALVNIERIVAALEIKPSLFFQHLDEHWVKQSSDVDNREK